MATCRRRVAGEAHDYSGATRQSRQRQASLRRAARPRRLTARPRCRVPSPSAATCVALHPTRRCRSCSPTTISPTSSSSATLFDARRHRARRSRNARTEDEVIAAARGLRRHPAAVRADHRSASSRRCRELGIVSRIGAGFDTVDTDACARHGVWVANSPDYGVGEVATHALALALALDAQHRRLPPRHPRRPAGTTCRRERCGAPANMTLGIVGLGRIGKRMAHISRNVFRRVRRLRPATSSTATFRRTSSARIARRRCSRRRDVVSLHMPLNDETRGMVGATMLRAHAKPGSYLVNTSRGAVVDVDAAARGARCAACSRGSALDVLPVEPVPARFAAARPSARHPDAARRVLFGARRSGSCGARRRRTS